MIEKNRKISKLEDKVGESYLEDIKILFIYF